MAVNIVEFLGQSFLRGPGGFPCPQEPFLAATVISSAGSTASLSTIALNAGTQLVSIYPQTQGAFFVFGSSTLGNPTSTQAEWFPANLLQFRGVKMGGKIIGWSS